MGAAGNAEWEPYLRTDVHDAGHAERTVRELLTLPRPPTALFTTDNRLTTGALRARRDHPAPPALIGFDDFDLADLLGTTVVAHDATALGRAAARLAQQRMSGHRGDDARYTGVARAGSAAEKDLRMRKSLRLTARTCTSTTMSRCEPASPTSPSRPA